MTTVSKLTDQAEAYSQQYGIPAGDTPGVNDAMDAFRHAYGSAVLARDYGSGLAEHGGIAWEILGLLNGDTEAASRMDAWNNGVGRSILEKLGPNPTNAEIAAEVKKAFDQGRLVTKPTYPAGESPFKKVDPKSNGSFNDARNFIPRRDPLVFDLDGDGLELAGASGVVLFDHNADGTKTGTGWAKPDDGFLVRDINGNGTIDTGRELFGVDTVKSNNTFATDGFDALRDLDSNHDGFITSADAAFGELKIWQDANQDGISQSTELKTLAQLNITRIGVNGSSTGPQAGQVINNNLVALSGTFTERPDKSRWRHRL
jgi:hypothetical protein